MLQGGCYCGAVRYECSGAIFQETICHCSICRAITGAPMVAWFSVAREHFQFVAGQPAQFDSTDHGRRTFCAGCGTQLTFASDRFAAAIDVTICSLDEPHRVPPRDHTWTHSRIEWLRLADGLPEYPETRDGD